MNPSLGKAILAVLAAVSAVVAALTAGESNLAVLAGKIDVPGVVAAVSAAVGLLSAGTAIKRPGDTSPAKLEDKVNERVAERLPRGVS